MSIRGLPWGKGDRCVRLTTLPPSGADCLKILRASTSRKPNSLSKDDFYLYYYQNCLSAVFKCYFVSCARHCKFGRLALALSQINIYVCREYYVVGVTKCITLYTRSRLNGDRYNCSRYFGAVKPDDNTELPVAIQCVYMYVFV